MSRLGGISRQPEYQGSPSAAREVTVVVGLIGASNEILVACPARDSNSFCNSAIFEVRCATALFIFAER